MEMLENIYSCFLVIFIFFPNFYCIDNCLDRPESNFRNCTSHHLSTYDDKKEMTRKLWTRTSISSVVRCSTLCMDDKNCVSYFFNKDAKTCTGHSIMFGNATAASGETGSKLYYLSGVKGYIGDLCEADNDCTTTSSECRADCLNTTTTSECSAKRCWCISGYSFSPSRHTCLPNCTVYGNDFMRTYLHFINFGNPADFVGVSTDECQQHCLQADSMCRSLMHGTNNLDCYLSNVTRLDVSDTLWLYDSFYYEYSYYQRDCL